MKYFFIHNFLFDGKTFNNLNSDFEAIESVLRNIKSRLKGTIRQNNQQYGTSNLYVVFPFFRVEARQENEKTIFSKNTYKFYALKNMN